MLRRSAYYISIRWGCCVIGILFLPADFKYNLSVSVEPTLSVIGFPKLAYKTVDLLIKLLVKKHT